MSNVYSIYRSKALLIFFLMLTIQSYAQLSAPIVESVYGGRILAIDGYAKNADTSRIFISTESANSVFYADVYANTSSPVFSQFQVMSGLDASAGYGSGIQQIQAHAASGKLFFIHQNNGLLSSHPSSSTINTIYSGGISSLLIEDDHIFFIEGAEFHFGTLDAAGNFTSSTGSPLIIPLTGGRHTIHKDPALDSLYIFTPGTSPSLYVLSDVYDSLDATTFHRDVSPSPTWSGTINWRAFGVRGDSWGFIIGDDGLNKYVLHNMTPSTSTVWAYFSMGINGVSGPNIAFSGSAHPYRVFHASAYSDNDGMMSSWHNFGYPGGMETHPNDGAVFVDPINENIIYMTTDQGIGASIDGGETIFEIDDGVEAVQVNDFDMTDDKNSAWLASKSGIRKVINYLTTPMWTNSIFPMGDGSPYYSVEMNQTDTNTVFVGNVRIYRSVNNGNDWQRVFTPENAPYNFPNVGIKALAIEICDFDTNIVMAGFEIQNTDKGGLFVSMDGGNSWDQILIEASSVGQDVDVSDIEFNLEGSDTTAYVSVLYDLGAPNGRSVYKVTKNGSSWNVQQDFSSSTTSVGYEITASIWDVEVSSSGDTVFAVGTDAGTNHPMSYYKPLNTTALWTPMTTSGFPFAEGKEATAVTLGIDTLYVAVDNEIYYYDLSGSSWTLGYSYPVGTRINFLYFDELLAGTDYGLFGHFGTGGTTDVYESNDSTIPNEFSLSQNYPNPFNPSTKIKFSLPASSNVKLQVFDILGREIKTLINSFKKAGYYEVQFDASELSSGVYIYRIQADNFISSKKMILLR